MGVGAPHKAPQLCSVAAAAIARVGSLADCTLIAEDGSSYKVSKAVVAVHSSVLGRMFHDITESTMSYVNLSDSPARVACIVNHIYGGSAYVLTSDNLLDCTCMADKYDMPQLQRAVQTFVQQLQLTVDNVPSFMATAHESPLLWELKRRCTEYAARRLQTILELRRRQEYQPTDWLMSLPKTTLIDIMQRHCSLLGGIIRAYFTRGPFVALTELEIVQQESMIHDAFV